MVAPHGTSVCVNWAEGSAVGIDRTVEDASFYRKGAWLMVKLGLCFCIDTNGSPSHQQRPLPFKVLHRG